MSTLSPWITYKIVTEASSLPLRRESLTSGPPVIAIQDTEPDKQTWCHVLKFPLPLTASHLRLVPYWTFTCHADGRYIIYNTVAGLSLTGPERNGSGAVVGDFEVTSDRPEEHASVVILPKDSDSVNATMYVSRLTPRN